MIKCWWYSKPYGVRVDMQKALINVALILGIVFLLFTILDH